MKPERIKKDGRVFQFNEVKLLQPWQIDPEYMIEIFPQQKMSNTGHLIAGRVYSQNIKLPSFVFRWDEKKESLDVDIENVDESVRKKFKFGLDGYSGHWTVRDRSNQRRTHVIEIVLPGRKIFSGSLNIPVGRELESEIRIKIAGTCKDVQHKKNE